MICERQRAMLVITYEATKCTTVVFLYVMALLMILHNKILLTLIKKAI